MKRQLSDLGFSFRFIQHSYIVGVSLLATIMVAPRVAAGHGGEHVILLHGLSRSPLTMKPMANVLKAAGYKTLILPYPSRTKTIQNLSDDHLAPAIKKCREGGAQKIHFVTHSMGGLLVRDYLSRNKLSEVGRVVMFSPPNQGSEVVDRLSHWRAFKALNGPAGSELGTAPTSPPKAMGPVTYPVGIIAGDRSINLINSYMIAGADDGKVSVEHTKVEGMTDHIVLHRTHPMMMRRRDAMALALRFLEVGSFR